MSGIIGGVGAKSGIIGFAGVQESYYPVRPPTHYGATYANLNTDLSPIIGSGNMENWHQYCNGVIPSNFSKVVDMHFWMYNVQADTGQNIKFAWKLAGHNELHTTHSLSSTASGAFDQVLNKIYKVNLMSVGGSSAAYFENLVSANDVFGMEFQESASASTHGLGVLIKYELKN